MTDRRIKERRSGDQNSGMAIDRVAYRPTQCSNGYFDERTHDRRVASTPRDFVVAGFPSIVPCACVTHETGSGIYVGHNIGCPNWTEYKISPPPNYAGMPFNQGSTPRETAASGEARLRQELQEIYDEDDCVEQMGARCARCESIMAVLAAAPALPQVTTEEARQELVELIGKADAADDWGGTGGKKFAEYLADLIIESGLLAALANRPARAAPEKEEK